MQPSNHSIVHLLEKAAKSAKSVLVYKPGKTDVPEYTSYAQLLRKAQSNSKQLLALPAWRHGATCLIRLDTFLSNMEWFWAVTLAGGIPAMCPPFAPADAQAKLDHLCRVLFNPVCLTTQDQLHSDFGTYKGSGVFAIEELGKGAFFRGSFSQMALPFANPVSSTAAVMLTSGSSGNSKAVAISHDQILSSISLKSSFLASDRPTGAFLNWVGMDHVAALIEVHMRSLALCVDQVHVAPTEIVSSPGLLLELLDRHKVSTTFSPNFLLAKIIDGVDQGHIELRSDLNLGNLRALISGGEACTTKVCQRMSQLLQKYGAPANAITPAFGMTETCAGCIYNHSYPELDSSEPHALASLGNGRAGIEVRVTSLKNAITAPSFDVLTANTVGNLEIRGPVVFKGYINNAEANALAFTSDGWFRTGDMGFINSSGSLVLTGRTKDVICINGISYLAVDQERAVEDANIPGVTPSYTVCFGWRPYGAATEQCCVVYQHSYDTDDSEARASAQSLISKAILLNIGVRPMIIPLPAGVLTRSSMGKLSRASISADFERGTYAAEIARNVAVLDALRSAGFVRPTNDAERKMVNIVESILQLEVGELSIDTPFLEVGVTSMDLIRMKAQICREFSLSTISVKLIITHNTVRSLAEAVSKLTSTGESSRAYEPVVKLRHTGSKTPLWLIHPGVGEVLVFVGLAQHMQDRPVYAMRVRGLEEGEVPFESITETVRTYAKVICSLQPEGPYALAGYSYGSMLAVEISKYLRASGKTIGFIGCFNLPPHIKFRMRMMTLQSCLVHLAMFLQLVSDAQFSELEAATKGMPLESAMSLVLGKSDQERWRELDLTHRGLARWAEVAYALHRMAVDYEPSGKVECLDIFYCDPLVVAARSKQEWLDVHLSKWRDFCEEAPVFHPVNGSHYTMLSAANIPSFHKTLEAAMGRRGI